MAARDDATDIIDAYGVLQAPLFIKVMLHQVTKQAVAQLSLKTNTAPATDISFKASERPFDDVKHNLAARDAHYDSEKGHIHFRTQFLATDAIDVDVEDRGGDLWVLARGARYVFDRNFFLLALSMLTNSTQLVECTGRKECRPLQTWPFYKEIDIMESLRFLLRSR